MTTAADDSAVEDAFEALLAGRPAPEGAAGLAAFTEAVRTSATRPGRPNAALAELLATGLLTDQSSPSARTARTAGSPPARSSRVRIRRRAAMIFPVLIAKFLSAGAIAQAATGAGVAVVVVTGVGAVGALPDPLQNTVSSVVETVTPFELPTGEEPVVEEPVVEEPVVEEPVVEEPVVEEPVVEDAAFDPEAWVAAGPAEDESFGAWVSASAHKTELREWLRAEGRTFGSMVRDWAHKKGMDDEDLAEAGVDLDDLTEEPVTEPVEEETATEPAPEAETEAADADATDKKSNGKGNAGGKSTGNGKGNGRN
jgi:hypothetical protein